MENDDFTAAASAARLLTSSPSFASTTDNLNATDDPSAMTITTVDAALEAEAKRIAEIGIEIYFYGLAFIIPVGLVCNALSIVVFLGSSTLRRTTTGQFLVVLATSDTIVLVTDAVRWINYDQSHWNFDFSNLDPIDSSDVACKALFYVRYAGHLMSSWTVVAITAQRLVAVALPLRVARLCTFGRTRCVIVVVAVASLALGAYPLWTLSIIDDRGKQLCSYASNCANVRQYENWTMVVSYILTDVLPMFVLTTLTTVILYFLTTARRRRLEFQPSVTTAAGKADHPENTHHRRGKGDHPVEPVPEGEIVQTGAVAAVGRDGEREGMRQAKDGSENIVEHVGHDGVKETTGTGRISTDTQLTLMLVAVCVAFICFKGPYAVVYYLEHYKYPYVCGVSTIVHDLLLNKKMYAVFKVTDMVATANYAINFFLYCLCGSTFRRQLRRRCWCCSTCCTRGKDTMNGKRGGRTLKECNEEIRLTGGGARGQGRNVTKR